MTSITRRTTLGLLGAALLNTGHAAAQTVTELRLTSVDAYAKPIYAELARQFSLQNPGVRINLEIIGDSWEEQFKRTVLDAATGNKADLAEQGLNLYRQVVDRSLAYPLDPFVFDDQGWAGRGYGPGLTELTRYRGSFWGLPFRLSSPVLYVNADLVRRAGGNPDALPATWSELIELASRITNSSTGATGLYFAYQAGGAWMFLTLLNLQGARAMSSDEPRIAFDGPEGLRAFELLRDIGRSGMQDMPRAQALQSFNAGLTGFYINAGSLINSVKRSVDGRFDFRTAPLPKLSPQAKLPVGGGALMILADDPARRRLAFEFARFATSARSQAYVAEQTGLTPANDLALAEPSLQTFYAQNPQLLAPAQQLPMLTDWETFPGPNAPKITDLIRDAMQAVITGRTEPRQALLELANATKALLPNA